MTNAIILLSGGIDSVVSLYSVRNNYRNILALTFNYKQKSYNKEKLSSAAICKGIGIEHRIVNIEWLGDISSSSLNTDINVPSLSVKDLDDSNKTKETANSVWVPNRNALFINIAASYAEALNYNDIIIGVNKEEAQTFKDNSEQFINAVNKSLENSTNKNIRVIAPLADKTKNEIIAAGIEMEIPFDLINSCYNSDKKHCGKCESCIRLKRALEYNNRQDIIEKIFK